MSPAYTTKNIGKSETRLYRRTAEVEEFSARPPRPLGARLHLSRQLRELAICTVALLTGAHYEYHHHAPDYLSAGGSQASLTALNAYVNAYANAPAEGLTSDEALVVQYAAQMTRDIEVDDPLFARMKERFETADLVEITAAIAAYNMVARFLVALRVTPEN